MTKECFKVRVPARLKEIIKEIANERNVSMSNLCNALLCDAILQTYQEEREYLPEYIKGFKKKI